VNANHLILDYVAICEKRGELLDLGEFLELWKVATEIAEETAREDRDAVLAGLLSQPE
jgi:hypothetical protein